MTDQQDKQYTSLGRIQPNCLQHHTLLLFALFSQPELYYMRHPQTTLGLSVSCLMLAYTSLTSLLLMFVFAIIV